MLHKGCVKVLRIIYLNRQECDKMFVQSTFIFTPKEIIILILFLFLLISIKDVTDHSYHSGGNSELKLGAAILLCTVKLISPNYTNLILSEIVRVYYLNESFLDKLARELFQFINGFNRQQWNLNLCFSIIIIIDNEQIIMKKKTRKYFSSSFIYFKSFAVSLFLR